MAPKWTHVNNLGSVVIAEVWKTENIATKEVKSARCVNLCHQIVFLLCCCRFKPLESLIPSYSMEKETSMLALFFLFESIISIQLIRKNQIMTKKSCFSAQKLMNHFQLVFCLLLLWPNITKATQEKVNFSPVLLWSKAWNPSCGICGSLVKTNNT